MGHEDVSRGFVDLAKEVEHGLLVLRWGVSAPMIGILSKYNDEERAEGTGRHSRGDAVGIR